MAIQALVAGASLLGNVVGGLLGNGVDEEQYDLRKSNINAATTAAQQGNVDAWLLLGAYGGIPLTRNINAHSISGWRSTTFPDGGVPAGWSSAKWGKTAYGKLIDAALNNYNALRSRFVSNGGNYTQQQGNGLLSPPLLPNVGNGNFTNNNESSQPVGLGGLTQPDPVTGLPAVQTAQITPNGSGLLWTGVAVGLIVLAARKAKLL
jgi:hypothetical protein